MTTREPVVLITGASRAEQVHENMKALNFAKKFSPDVMTAIEEALDGLRQA